ncbi:hypothetical protein [Saccharopolyspora sp. CA-218241]|uniref:hypothetical protein n=1 Tax=Saccharopolyspora sp. CA-218241 TaxID=3240027 RepID=UPI003D99AC07
MGSETAPPLWRHRSFLLLLIATFGGFAGYVLLLPVVPLWAVLGARARSRPGR